MQQLLRQHLPQQRQQELEAVQVVEAHQVVEVHQMTLKAQGDESRENSKRYG
jgi:hypothetical protein